MTMPAQEIKNRSRVVAQEAVLTIKSNRANQKLAADAQAANGLPCELVPP